VDPFTGRNPSYCFVDLQTKEHAERAMVELDGRDMLGRPVKIKPGVAKSAERAAEQPRTPFAMSRWRERPEGSPTSSPTSFAKVNHDSSQRVYVGGLPRLTEPESVQSNMRTFFQGYNVYVARKNRLCGTICSYSALPFVRFVTNLCSIYLVRMSARCSPHTPQSDSSLVTTTICSST
jgi:RNA recognition motif-containing protein